MQCVEIDVKFLGEIFDLLLIGLLNDVSVVYMNWSITLKFEQLLFWKQF